MTGGDHRDRAIDRVGEARKRGGAHLGAGEPSRNHQGESQRGELTIREQDDRPVVECGPTSATATDTAGINATLTGSLPLLAPPAGGKLRRPAPTPPRTPWCPTTTSTKASKVAVGGSPYVAVSR